VANTKLFNPLRPNKPINKTVKPPSRRPVPVPAVPAELGPRFHLSSSRRAPSSVPCCRLKEARSNREQTRDAGWRRWLETKSWILAGEPYDRMKLARVLMTAAVSSKGPRIDSEAKNAILAVALLMEEDAVNVHAESITEAIVSKLVERIEPVTHRMASADFAAANGLAQAETTLTLKDVSTQLQSVTSSLNEALAKTVTQPQPATTPTQPTWADITRAKPLAIPMDYNPDFSAQ
ncbi:hypothetical protein C0993_000728, partial [Termitomyces sp. T159_Od127]